MLQQAGSYTVGKHGRPISLEMNATKDPEIRAIEAEEERQYWHEIYPLQKLMAPEAHKCSCGTINCPDQVHTTGRLRGKKSITRGNSNTLCLGCG